MPTMPRTSSVSSGDGLNNGLPCRVRVVISTMALDVNYIHPTLGRCNCRSATMACSGTKRRDRGIPDYRQGTSDVASSADQPGRAAIKTPPCGEVPESCSMHAQTAPSIRWDGAERGPIGQRRRAIGPDPGRSSATRRFKTARCSAMAEPGADLRFSHSASNSVSVARLDSRRAGALNGNGGGKAQRGNMSDSSRARSRRRAAPVRKASTKAR